MPERKAKAVLTIFTGLSETLSLISASVKCGVTAYLRCLLKVYEILSGRANAQSKEEKRTHHSIFVEFDHRSVHGRSATAICNRQHDRRRESSPMNISRET